MEQALERNQTRSRNISVKAWYVAACFVGSLLFALFQGGKLAYMLLMIVSVLCLYLVLGRWSGITSVKGARTLESGRGSYVAGSSIRVRLQAHIPGFWPVPYVIVNETIVGHQGDHYPFEMTFVPDWKRRGEIVYTTPPLSRGFYRFNETICMTEDIFGLFQHEGKLRIDDTFSVLPKTVPIREWAQLTRLIRGAHDHTVTTKALRETTQINGVREYVYGDRISRIHWNATARTGTWKSKEFERETLPKTIVVLDRQSEGYRHRDDFELAVSAAASIFQYGGARHIALGLISIGKTVTYMEASKSELHHRKIQEHLIGVMADGHLPPEQVIQGYMDRLVKGSFVVFISPRTVQQMSRAVQLLKSRQLNVCHLWIRPNASPDTKGTLSAQLKHLDHTVMPLFGLEDLPVMLEGKS